MKETQTNYFHSPPRATRRNKISVGEGTPCSVETKSQRNETLCNDPLKTNPGVEVVVWKKPKKKKVRNIYGEPLPPNKELLYNHVNIFDLMKRQLKFSKNGKCINA
jgi:hypothetical protein